MSRFYVEDIEQIWACFRCGEVMGDIRENSTGGAYTCESCGENSIITFVSALDIINDLYLQGDLTSYGEEVEFYDDIDEE